MSMDKISFKANAGIKDIIGRGLILDDNIAIIELIKNSKDASAEKVKINFLHTNGEAAPSEIILSDCGHGMSLEDIKEKWLNIAYSEKKGEKNKVYAGNKGVGRFSCDRLGEQLILYSKAKNGDYLKLPIDWRLYEVNDQNAEISSIDLVVEKLSEKKFLEEIGDANFKAGTVLKISHLRSSWKHAKIKKLITELEKFVSAPDSEFQVYLSFNGEEEQIQNNVFDELPFRTYYIKSSISSSGRTIKTSVNYHGKTIYQYSATNPYKNLKNISVNIHYLNFTSKSYFKRRTGYGTNEYGSVFLFLNGFRVFPYGNPKNDWLGLDQRKSQGTSRYLGTRDIMGKVNIEDHDDIFKPVSSREGMVENIAFRELTAHDQHHKVELKNGEMDYGYLITILRQLERIIVEGTKWHNLVDLKDPQKKGLRDKDLKQDPTKYALQKIESKAFEGLVKKVLKAQSFDIKEFKINTELIKKLSAESEDAYNEYILTFIKNTTNKSFQELSPKEKGSLKKLAQENMRALRAEKEAERRLLEAEKKAQEAKSRAITAEAQVKVAEKKAKVAEKKAKKVEEELSTVKSENIFLKSDASKDLDHIINLHHQIVLYSSTAESEIENLKNLLTGNKKVASQDVMEFILSIESDITKISKVSHFATNQKYKLALNSVEGNLIKFISDYLNEINNNNLLLRRMSLKNKLDTSIDFKTEFSPMDIMTLVDNLISNTRRVAHNATKKTRKRYIPEISFLPPISDLGLFIVKDKGPGLDPSIKVPSMVFEKGFTTTEGSGRGLYHVSETLKALGLNIHVVEDDERSDGFTLEVTKDAN